MRGGRAGDRGALAASAGGAPAVRFSSRVHSGYVRRLHDSTAGGRPVQIRLAVRLGVPKLVPPGRMLR